MLQIVIEENERYSVPELAQMAIEGGCGWIVLRMPEATDEQIREVATEIIPLCKETSTIFTIENHIEVAKELGVHGVYLKDCPTPAFDVRESFGPEAIIGVEIGMASAALSLLRADIDYVVFGQKTSLAQISENVEALREAKFELPIVAEGTFALEDIPAVLATGVNGLAIGAPITTAADPVAQTEKYIQKIVNSEQ